MIFSNEANDIVLLILLLLVIQYSMIIQYY